MRLAVVFRTTVPVAVLALAACSTAPVVRETAPPRVDAPRPGPVTRARSATVALAPASGSLVSGKLVAVPAADGVRLTGEIGGLTRGGTHAIHVHENGECSAADATSAGAHFNPTRQAHGRAGPGPHHGGDMDNLVADANGVARVDVRAVGVELSDGGNGIGGRAVVVHAAADDYTSQPAGNAGARLACGVVKLVP